MSERIGYMLISMDTMTEVMSGAVKLPKGTEVLRVTMEPSIMSGMENVRMNFSHPSLDVIETGDKIPQYNVIFEQKENGEYTAMFERVELKLERKKYNFSDRFELEQDILRLWGMFDYIHLIVHVLDRKGSTMDEVANITWGLVNMMREQHQIVYSYSDAERLSITMRMQASKLYRQLDDLMGEYYDGEFPLTIEQMVQKILYIQKEGDVLFSRIFEEFEEQVCRGEKQVQDTPF